MSSWCHHRSISRMHKIRFYCHLAAALMSVALLLSTSIVLAYSMKMYRGSYLHSIPELLTASSVELVVLGLAWLPSDQYPGIYGLNCMRAVWQELIWTSALCLGLFGGLSSLHQATPGLMSSCGRFFICRGYIFVFVTAWLNWLLLALPTGLLLSSTLYQARRNLSGDAVWKTQVDQFEYFWPGQASPKIRPFTYAIDLPRQPDSAQIKSTSCDLPLEDEKHRSSPPPEYS